MHVYKAVTGWNTKLSWKMRFTAQNVGVLCYPCQAYTSNGRDVHELCSGSLLEFLLEVLL